MQTVTQRSTNNWFGAPLDDDEILLSRGKARNRSGWLISLGLVMVVVGVIALLNTVAATLASVFVLAAYLAIGGVVHAVDAFTGRRWNLATLDVLAAVVYFVAAWFAVRQPFAAAATITIVLSVLFMVGGAMRFVGGLALQPKHWGWVMAHGVIMFLLGLMFLTGMPVTGLTAPGILVGVDLVLAGISLMALGILVRRTLRADSGQVTDREEHVAA